MKLDGLSRKKLGDLYNWERCGFNQGKVGDSTREDCDLSSDKLGDVTGNVWWLNWE